ncbi:MAG: hypothetical protein KC589_01740 [Nanoarchaeota archaeon]|nr:hypothetical protein [Nanoarchaeota archaeon]
MISGKRVLYFFSFLFLVFFIFNSWAFTDLDLDGIDDSWESLFGFNSSFFNDSLFDNDSDSLINLWEFRLGFNPFINNSDSNLTVINESQNSLLDSDEDLDSDGRNNSYEILNGFDPRVSVLKRVDISNLSFGDEVIYFINLTILDGLENGSLVDSLPNNLIYLNSSNSNNFLVNVNSNLVNWTLGNLNGSGTYFFNITTYLNNSNSLNYGSNILENFAYVYFENENNSYVENSSTSSLLVVEPLINLNLENNVSSVVSVLENFSYLINLSNLGSLAYNVSVVDYFPDGFIFVSSNNPVNFSTSNLVQFVFANSSAIINPISIIGYFNRTYSNGALLSANDFLMNEVNISYFSSSLNFSRGRFYQNYSFENISISNLNMNTISLMDGNLLDRGDLFNVSLRLYLENSSSLNSVLNSSFSNGLELDNYTSNSGVSPSFSSGRIIFDLANVSYGSDYYFNFSFRVNASAYAGDVLNLTSVFSYDSYNTGNYFLNSYTSVNVSPANLSLSLISNVSTPIGVLENFSYFINFTNSGTLVYNVSVVDYFPDGFIFVSSNNLVNFSTSNFVQFLFANSSAIINPISVVGYFNRTYSNGVLLSANDVLENKVNYTAFSSPVSTGAFEYSDEDFVNNSILDLNLNQLSIHEGDNLSVGDLFNISLRLYLENSSSLNSVLNSSFSNGLELDNYTTNSGVSPSFSSGRIIFDLANVSYGSNYYFNFSFRVNASANSGDVLNLTSVFSYDSYNTGNYSLLGLSSFNVVKPNISLIVYSNVSFPISVLENFSYFINLSNLGSLAYNVSVIDYFPDGFIYVSSNNLVNFSTSNLVQFVFVNSSSLINPISIVGYFNRSYSNGVLLSANDVFENKVNYTAFSSKNFLNSFKYFGEDFVNNSILDLNLNQLSIHEGGNLSVGDLFNISLRLYLENSSSLNSVLNSSFSNGLELDNYTSNSGVSPSFSSGRIIFDLANVSYGSDYYFNFSFRVNASVYAGDVLNLTSVFSYDSYNTGNYSLEALSSVNVREPQIVLNVAAFSPVSVGDVLTYVINISNVGNYRAYNLTIFDKLSDGTIFYISNPSEANVSGNNSEIIKYNFSSLDFASYIQINLSVNISDSYYNLSNVLANDTLFNFLNMSYFSSEYLNYARSYFNFTNASSVVQQGSILKNTSGSISINSSPAVRIGEPYLYNIILNFSGAPANSVNVRDALPSSLQFLSSNNSLNDSAFSVNGSLLEWNFGDLNKNITFININVSVYVVDNLTINYGTLISNWANLTYRNSDYSSILRRDSADIYIVEPNVNITNILLSSPLIGVSDLVTYNLNVSNFPRQSSIFNSEAFYLNLTNYIPDGFVFNSSTLGVNFSNLTHLIWDLGVLGVNSSVAFNITFKVNSSYLDSSLILSGDSFVNVLNFSSYGRDNLSVSRRYSFSRNSLPVTILNSSFNVSLSSLTGTIGDIINTSIYLNFSSAPVNNLILNISLPDGSSYINSNSSLNYSLSFGDVNNKSLIFDFGNLSNLGEYYLNISSLVDDTYLNSSFLIYGDLLTFNYSLSYESSDMSNFSFLKNASYNIVEPNLNITNILVSSSIVEVDDLVNYSILISNFPRVASVYNSEVYNLTVNNFIPDGLIFNYSTLSPDFLNVSNLIWNFSNISVNSSIEINLSFRVNVSYLDSSLVLSDDVFVNRIDLGGYSNLNENKSRMYVLNRSAQLVFVKAAVLNISQDLSSKTIGDIFVYNSYLNFTAAPANGVIYNFTLANGLEVLNHSGTNSYNYTFDVNNLIFDFGNLSSRDLIELNITVLVNESRNDGDLLDSIGFMSYLNSNLSLNFNSSDSLQKRVSEANLNISIFAFSPVSVSDLLTYVINVSNIGNYTAYNVDLFSLLPNGSSFISALPAVLNLTGYENESVQWNYSTIVNGSKIGISLVVNITNFYYDNSYVLANDTLINVLNVSYTSVQNLSLARNYFDEKNVSVVVKDGAISKNTSGTIIINSSAAARIGEPFVYEIFLNFSGAPANVVNVRDDLPSSLQFLSSNNSLNDSAFSVNGSLLEWNFGNLNPNITFIYINLTTLIIDNLSNVFSTNIFNQANLTYENSLGSSILKQDGVNIYVIEPNLNLSNILLSSSFVEVGDLVRYNLNVSNLARMSSIYNSEAFYLNLTNYIPDGFVFNSSTLPVNFSNSSHLIWDLGVLSVNSSVVINVTFKVNSSYLDSSLVLSGDSFVNVLNLSSYSSDNRSVSRLYSFSFASLPVVVSNLSFDVNLSSLAGSIGDLINSSLLLNFSGSPANNVILNVSLPDGSSYVSSNSSLNYSLNFGDVNNKSLIFDFGNLSALGVYYLNFSSLIDNTYLNSSFVNDGDFMNINYSLSYESSNGSVFIFKKNLTYSVVESFIQIGLSMISNNVKVGNNLTYIMNFSNFGNSMAYDLEVINLIPNGTSFISSSPVSGVVSGSNDEIVYFNLGNLTNGVTYNLTMILYLNDSYFDGSNVVSNDVLSDFFNLTYKSSANESLARNYYDNLSIVNFVGDIYMNTSLNSVLFSQGYGSSFGNEFIYSALINFSNSNAPANNVILFNTLPENFVYMNSTNSLNNSLLTINGSNLYWNFGNLDKGIDELEVNVSGYIANNLSYNLGNNIFSFFDLNYTNSLNDNYNLTSNFSYYVLEPNVTVSVFSLDNSVPINGTLNYTIVVSNLNGSSYISRAYNVTIYNLLDDGSNLISSSLLNLGDDRNLIFDLGILEVGEIRQINLSLFVNDTLLNMSENKKDELYFYPQVNFSSSQYNGRNYSNSSIFVNVINDIRAPKIESIYLNPKALAVSQNLSLELFASDFIAIDFCWANMLYPNSTSINISNVCNLTNVVIPNLIGNYNFTFYVNDSSGNLNISNKISISVGPLVVWNSTIFDNNSNPVSTNITIFYNDSLVVSDLVFNGSLEVNISDFNYDILFETYNSTVSIRLNNVSSILSNNKNFGIDKMFNKDGNLVVYGVYNENYSFSQANIRISYSDISYDSVNDLKLSVCDNWNFTARNCISSWLNHSFSLDIINSDLVFNRSSFSAFGIYEYDAPSGGGGGGGSSPPPGPSLGGGGGDGSKENVEEVIEVVEEIIDDEVVKDKIVCVENWVCNSWSECTDGISERRCSDLNNCNGQNYVSLNSKTCGLDYNLTGNFISKYFFSEKGSKRVLAAVDKGAHILKFYGTFFLMFFLIYLAYLNNKFIEYYLKPNIIKVEKRELEFYFKYSDKQNMKFLSTTYVVLLLVLILIISLFTIGLVGGVFIGLLFELFYFGYLMFFYKNKIFRRLLE